MLRAQVLPVQRTVLLSLLAVPRDLDPEALLVRRERVVFVVCS